MRGLLGCFSPVLFSAMNSRVRVRVRICSCKSGGFRLEDGFADRQAVAVCVFGERVGRAMESVAVGVAEC